MAGKKRRFFGAGSKRAARRFITYGGYIQELDMFLNDGYYFKVYLPGEPIGERGMPENPMSPAESAPDPEGSGNKGSVLGGCLDRRPLLDDRPWTDPVPAGVLGQPGFRIQLIATRDRVYELLGVKAGSPEEAAERFRTMEHTCPYRILTCREWFALIAGQMGREPFPGLPEEKKGWGGKKSPAAISLVQPHQVTVRQKELETAGRVVRTLILMGGPSGMFPAFATELLRAVSHLTLSVFAEELDKGRCLEGLELSGSIPAARKAAMKEFLEQCVKEETRIYNTCALVSVCGKPGEVEKRVRVLEAFCRKYRVRLSGLDYQQADAYRSVLPLMKNRIRYNRVLAENSLKALLPWSLLDQCRKHVCYGEDVITGRVDYDRRIHRENGLILSGSPDWALEQAKKEIRAFAAAPAVPGETVSILAGADTDLSALGEGEEKEFLVEGTDGPGCRCRSVSTDYGTVYQVLDAGERGKEAYIRLLGTLRGIVYSLNSEYLAGNPAGLWDVSRLHGDTLYTFLSRDNRTFYGSREFGALLEVSPFLLAGEHRIFEKLELAGAAGLDRQQRDWISEPAEGAYLRTGLVSWLLKKESMDGGIPACQGQQLAAGKRNGPGRVWTVAGRGRKGEENG